MSNAEHSILMPYREMHVTLIGSGNIAEEIFKVVFWCGQMAGYLLHIHVISKTANEMKARITHDCPELFESCREHSELLKIYQHDGDQPPVYAPPYAVCDDFIDDVEAEFILDYPGEIIEKTDYFVVALGSDGKNTHVASMLSEEIQRRMLHEGKNRRPVIVPIVYDDQLAETLRSDGADQEPYAPYVLPFGNLRERFSCENIFMYDVTAKSLKTDELYDMSRHTQRMKDDYNYWSSIARTIHAPYKVFSLSRLLSLPLTWYIGEELECKQLTVEGDDENDHIIAWMEHRRWNAYMRSKGFSCPDNRQQALNAFLTGSCKNVPLKMHPCLVECGIKKLPLHIQGLPLDRSAGYDHLDLVSIYNYLIGQVIGSDRVDRKDTELFYDKEALLYGKNGAHIIEKYGIYMENLAEEEYKRYDSVAYDDALKCIIRYEQPS